jgi:hypothetical protein
MKVKVVEVTGHQFNYDDDYSSMYVKDSETEWVEVAQEEYEALKQWATDNNKNKDYTYEAILIIVVQEKPKEEIKAKVEEYIEKAKVYLKQKAEQEKKRIEQDKKMLERNKKKVEEREKKAFAKLQKKYEIMRKKYGDDWSKK